MAFSFKKEDVSRSLKFTGVVVESKVYTPANADYELWKMTYFNRNTGKFQPLFGESVRMVEPESNGFAASGIRKRLTKWYGIQVDVPNAEQFEGYEVDLETVINDWEGGTSVRCYPVKKVGRVGPTELASLKARLEEERTKAQDAKGGGRTTTTATPAATMSTTLSDDDAELLMGIYAGKTDEEAQVAAAKAKLPNSLLNAVATGAASQELIGRGMLDIDGDSGKYVTTG